MAISKAQKRYRGEPKMKKSNTLFGLIFTAILVIIVAISGCATNTKEQTQGMSIGDNVAKQTNTEKTTSVNGNPTVVMETSKGTIEIELYPDKAPISVENFLSYVNEGYYDGLIFHRVIANFMIQGGGFDKDLNQKETKAPIKNEAGNGLKNERGTIAMARTMVVDSATSQFFINVVDNEMLDYKDNSIRGFGYAVFGKVTKGMEVVDAIKAVKTGSVGQFQDVPVEPVIITKVYVRK
jgi:peptidyl-prolyl cis-trans isomerase B (cyclophilin B)